ncbi:hypothetical protein ABEB36_002309 [Hypothenemus hampei]|uniref:ribonuclease H n=1 Tax=Hypothenemus hampei TaxID=57062 RepID=A0ABD1F5D6_HYPHA
MNGILKLIRQTSITYTKMENLISNQLSALVQRLSDAENRALVLLTEVKNIKAEIATLTQSANSILNSNIALTRSPDDEHSHQLKRPRFNDQFPMENGYVVAYTDGACVNNGMKNAKAGIGVWFSDGHSQNISKPVRGKPTNNNAEIQAATEALRLLQSLGYTKAKIYTDSQFTINCITNWIKRWKKNNWKVANGGAVKNKECLVELDQLCQQFDDIKWEYCAGHQGIHGNEEADKLARQGASKY